ncbi:hypothetical protein E2320_006847 [Naja naja]|nr:hypothetical protein E2320_006847 [Naja naja]
MRRCWRAALGCCSVSSSSSSTCPTARRLSWAWKNTGQRRRISQLRGAMRLVQFQAKGSSPEPRIGLEERDGGDVVDLNAFDPSLPRTMRAFLEAGEAALAVARSVPLGSHHRPR